MSSSPSSARTRLPSSAAEAVEAAQAYAASLTSGVIERDRTGSVPWAELAALDASGLLAITVPAAHGGPDLSPVALAEVIRLIAAVDPAIAQVTQPHFLFIDGLATLGSAAQQAATATVARLRQPRSSARARQPCRHCAGPPESELRSGVQFRSFAGLPSGGSHTTPRGDRVIGSMRESGRAAATAAPQGPGRPVCKFAGTPVTERFDIRDSTIVTRNDLS